MSKYRATMHHPYNNGVTIDVTVEADYPAQAQLRAAMKIPGWFVNSWDVRPYPQEPLPTASTAHIDRSGEYTNSRHAQDCGKYDSFSDGNLPMYATTIIGEGSTGNCQATESERRYYEAGKKAGLPVDPRDEFETWYLTDMRDNGFPDQEPGYMKNLREGDEYGAHRTALNGKWKAWRASRGLK